MCYPLNFAGCVVGGCVLEALPACPARRCLPTVGAAVGVLWVFKRDHVLTTRAWRLCGCVQQSRNTIACVGVVARQAQGYCFALDMCWTSALEDAAMESYQIVKILAATRIDVCAAPREETNSIYGDRKSVV